MMTAERPLTSVSLPPFFTATVFFERNNGRYRVAIKHVDDPAKVGTVYVPTLDDPLASLSFGIDKRDMKSIVEQAETMAKALRGSEPAPAAMPPRPKPARAKAKARPPAPPPSLDWITQDTPIADLHFLSARCRHALIHDAYGHACETVADMLAKTEAELLRAPNFGRKSLNELKPIRAMFTEEPPHRRLLPPMPADIALDTRVEDLLFISARVRHSLVHDWGYPWSGPCLTVADILNTTDRKLERPNIGRKGVRELQALRQAFKAKGPRLLSPDADEFHRWCERNRPALEALRRHRWLDADPDFDEVPDVDEVGR